MQVLELRFIKEEVFLDIPVMTRSEEVKTKLVSAENPIKHVAHAKIKVKVNFGTGEVSIVVIISALHERIKLAAGKGEENGKNEGKNQ